MWGTLAATVVGALANDSGPTIFLIGATALVLAAAYVSGKRRTSALT
jgi:1,4-dihydroxy-2-naphthoate octaprenyltransferase